MRKNMLILGCILFIATFGCHLVDIDETKQQGKNPKGRKYEGVKQCANCHKRVSKGDQYGQWQNTAHAEAYKALGTPKAKEIATNLGLAEDPQKSIKCLKCHVTGAEESPDLTKAIIPEEGVQCESCHGPGQDYIAVTAMRDRNLAILKGLVIPTKEVCLRCHNEASPTYQGFDFEAYYEVIAHPRPPAK